MPVSMNLRYVAVGACGASAFIDMYATQPILPQLRTIFGAGEAAVGATVTAVTLACAVAAPFIGPLADRLGRKRVIVSAIVLLALVTFGAATATTLGALLVWRFLQGLFMPGIFAVTVAYIGEEFPFAVAGRAIGAYMTGNVIGGFFGRYLAAVIAGHMRWETVFIVLGVLNLLGAAFVLIALPRARHFVRSPSLATSLRAIGGFVRNPTVAAIYAVGGSVLFTNVAVFTFVTFHLAAPPFSLPTVALGNVFVVYLLGIVSAPAGGVLIDRLGNRTTALLALGVSSGGLLVTLIPSVAAIVAGLAILSSSVFVTQMCSQGLIGRVVTENRSTAAALYFTVYYGLGGLGAVVPAPAWAYGGWPATVGVILAVQIVAAVIIVFGWRVPSRGTAPTTLS
jgi:MFS transporter, YNFM family, putative membrane transport protein